MHGGRARTQRSMLVAQAALVWNDKMTGEDYSRFIDSGSMASSAAEAAPYNAAVLEAISKEWNM